MDNKAKIRYRLQPVFETGVAFQILDIPKAEYPRNKYALSEDFEASNGWLIFLHPDVALITGIHKFIYLGYKEKFFTHIDISTYEDKQARDTAISEIHSALAEFAVKAEVWGGDVWAWYKIKNNYSGLSFVNEHNLREIVKWPGIAPDQLVTTIFKGWLPWTPDMPLPKPRSLGNNTFEVCSLHAVNNANL